MSGAWKIITPSGHVYSYYQNFNSAALTLMVLRNDYPEREYELVEA